MSRTIRGQVDGSVVGALHLFGAQRSTIIPWDLSASPKDNSQRAAKLGAGDATHFSAFLGFDANTHASPMDNVVWRVAEPDNWVPRFHDAGGKGVDNVWALRFIAGHGEDSDSRLHRSTIIVDDSKRQEWAWLMDLAWVVNLEASIKDTELGFDDAGFLASLSGGKGKKTRGALAGNLALNAGFMTDGAAISQLWHVLSPVYKLASRPESEPPTEKTELTLRSDVYFNTGKRRWVLCPKSGITANAAGTSILVGQLFLDAPGSDAKPLIEDEPKIKPVKDAKSNQPVLERGKYWPTRVYVQYTPPTIPPKHQYPPPQNHTTTPKSPPVPTVDTSGWVPSPPVYSGQGPTTVCHSFLPGDFQGLEMRWPIPEEIAEDSYLEITMEFSITAAYTGMQSTIAAFMYRAVENNTTPGSYTEVDKTFASADSFAVGKWKKAKFIIPATTLTACAGGTAAFWVMTAVGSTGPRLLLGETFGRFCNDSPAPAAGFSFI